MPRRKEKPLITFVVDTREQYPYTFNAPRKKDKFDDGGQVTYKLDEGDYAVELDGKLLPIRIERKMHGDFVGVVGRNRDRFAGTGDTGLYQSGPNTQAKCELERLRPFRSFLLIEATIEQVRDGFERSMVPGSAAWESCWCWAVRYGITPIFAGNRKHGRDIAQSLLEEFALHFKEATCQKSEKTESRCQIDQTSEKK